MRFGASSSGSRRKPASRSNVARASTYGVRQVEALERLAKYLAGLDPQDQRIHALWLGNTEARTYLGWARRDGSSTNDLLVTADSANATRPVLFLTTGADTVRWRTRNNDTGATSQADWAWPGTGTWVFWGLHYDPTADTATLYLNGASVSTATGLTQTFTGSNNFEAYGNLEGRGAHVAILSRDLTAVEWRDLYLAGIRTRHTVVGF